VFFYLLCFNSFQSLFCWISVSDNQKKSINQSIKLFQSLFCWISVSDWTLTNWFRAGAEMVSILVLLDFRFGQQYPLGFQKPPQKSFNPCFVGFPFRTTSRNANTKIYHQFQSLFCWISVSDLHKRSPRNRVRRFNPCFVGFPFRTIMLLFYVLLS